MKRLRLVIRLKVYFDRARMYLGYAQFIMILLVLINSAEGKLDFITNYYYVSFPLIVLLFLLIGYFDTKLGIRREEMRNLSGENPVHQNILKGIKEINAKIK